MAININSESECRAAYLNYRLYNNTKNISDEEIGAITDRWSSYLNSWEASVSSDQNEYEISDEDTQEAHDAGEEKGKEATGGYERDAGEKAEAQGVCVAGAVSATCIISKFKTLTKNAKDAKSKPYLWGIATAEALAAASYWLLKPNKDGVEAATDIQQTMLEQQQNLDEATSEMEANAEETEEKADEATEAKEETDEEIETQYAEFASYQAGRAEMQARIDAGETLTESEQAYYEEAGAFMNEIAGEGGSIATLTEEAGEENDDIQGEIEDLQDAYDNSAEVVAETEGVTDYAASFDEDTKDSANLLGYVLGASAAVSGVVAGKLFMDGNPLTKAASAVFAGVSVGAAISQGAAAKEQFEYANVVEAELDVRSDTEDFNGETADYTAEKLDEYVAHLEGVQDLEYVMPEEFEEYEEQPETLLAVNSTPTTEESTTEPVKKKEEDDEQA